jgi:hypothetical protein
MPVSHERMTTLVASCVMYESEKAWRFLINGVSYWLPKALIETDGDIKVGDADVTVRAPHWLCESRGIED